MQIVVVVCAIERVTMNAFVELTVMVVVVVVVKVRVDVTMVV